MSASLGTLCIVLHGHLPYVLSHGSYPHGEAWLFEAAAETYLPLLDMIGECALLKARPATTIGITPVLVQQLSDERFKIGFVAYLKERIGRARFDRADFDRRDEKHLAGLAADWEAWYQAKLNHFERIDRDIPHEFAARLHEGHIQILTSNATHAYLPLLLNDQSIRAQMSAGMYVSQGWLGENPRGMWLPECAYRPDCENWKPAVLYDDPRHRPGLETFIADAGVNHFFVDTHLITEAEPIGTIDHGHFDKVSEAQLYWDQMRSWRDILEPAGVVSHAEAPRCFAFGRHPRISEQVWSGSIGYPGDGVYLEFHKKHNERGLRYWRVTDHQSGLGDKQPYNPADIEAKVHEHAQHFCAIVREVLKEHRDRTGRPGVCVAPFDAELFGHWWFEGPRFLRNVILTLAHDESVELLTAQDALERYPADKVMRLPEGSWGEKGNHSVWINDHNRWMWEIEYRAENRMLRLLHELPWQSKPAMRQLLEKAGRQLLLLQASDWPFVVHTRGALDYGIQRFAGHATAFDRLATMSEDVAAGKALTPLQRIELQEIDAHDSVFAHIDLNWWNGE